MRSSARFSRRAERPHTTPAARTATATTAIAGRSSMSGQASLGRSGRPLANVHLEGGVPEAEVLSDLPLQVPQVRGRKGPVGEQREGGRVDRSLGGVEHTAGGC